MKKRKLPQMQIRCDKCNAEAEIDKEKSNDNWRVYKTDKPCKCGGKFKMKFI